MCPSKSMAQQEALERLALVEPHELSGEAKAEICRATRDLRSCGRSVHRLLSCGHACLCVECRQRCDSCPICRAPITNSVPDKPRLYDQCLEAGLIREDNGIHSESNDIRRLCSFFDVALENNFVSLVCHYVTEVCMDEGAVSSNALVSILLDGGLVKDWCKRTFYKVALTLRDIYSLGAKQMYDKADVMDRSGRKLEGIVQVLEALEVPLVDQPLSPSFLELRQLLESLRKVLQHVEVMSWCARHHFLDNIPSRHVSIAQWCTAVKERKTAAQDRAWPEPPRTNSQMGTIQPASLFIEEALANLGLSKEDDDEDNDHKDLLELNWLRQAPTVYTPISVRYAGSMQSSALYPPENVRAAVDLLFLEGTSDLILAKKAIFLYYLFDRYWTLADLNWRAIVDDYVGTFSIPRHFMLESLVFYLLDDSNEQALEEACRLLPEISSQNIHPKVVGVLLDRQKAEAALAVLRASGRDGQAGGAVPLPDALTAIRVWLQCGLLTEGYLYQRGHCDNVKREGRDWVSEMEVLVEEVCRSCMRMNSLDKMLVLPWRKDEEKIVRKCLLERAGQEPSSTAGNLLVVFYVQRCRYVEACAVHRMLCDVEHQWLERSTDDAKVARVLMASEQRTRIIDNCMELLPEIQRQQARNNPEPEAQPPQPTVEIEHRFRTLPLASPLFGRAEVTFNREATLAEEHNDPSTSAWADYNPPSSLYGRLGLQSSAPPTPILSNLTMPVTNGPTSIREFGNAGGSPVQGRRLRYEAEPSREPSFPVFESGELRSVDGGVDLAVPSPWGGEPEKRMSGKVNGIDFVVNGSLLTAENGSQRGGMQSEDDEHMEVDVEGSRSWAVNGKRHPSDRSWLHRQSPEKDTQRGSSPLDIDGWDEPPAIPSIFLSEPSRRGSETVDDNGGVRWRSDEGNNESAVPAYTPSSRVKSLPQGRSRSRFYSGRV